MKPWLHATFAITMGASGIAACFVPAGMVLYVLIPFFVVPAVWVPLAVYWKS